MDQVILFGGQFCQRAAVLGANRPKTFESQWPPEVFEAILDAVKGDRWRYTLVHTGRERPRVPTPQDLRRLVEVSLSASLEREEGRDVLFSLVYVPPPGDRATCFDPHALLEVEQVRRVAPALESHLGLGISVAGDQTNGRLVTWGITERREDAVEVRAVGPGRVGVRFGLVNVARFEGTRCTVFDGDAVRLLEVLADLLPPVDEESYLLALYLVQIGMAVRSLSHGGTLVLLSPSSSEPPAYMPNYMFRPAFEELAHQYKEHLTAYQALLKQQPDESPLYVLSLVPDIEAFLADRSPGEKMNTLVGRVARLAAVDGAVVLTSNLSVICAGAVLEASAKDPGRWQEWHPTMPSLQRKTGRLGGFRGTRHRSAFEFVTANPGTVAMVCSEDGGITMLAQPKSLKEPVVLRNIEVALA